MRLEHRLLHGWRWVTAQGAVVWGLALALLVAWWLCNGGGDAPQRRRRAPAAAATTLHDPQRLQTALQLFATTDHRPPPHDGRMRTEHLCRVLLEAMLGFPLPKVRPKWLKNPTTRRCLELDMYSEEHRLAFEVDGAQHEVYTPHFHVTPEQFEYRKLLDRLKTELCHEHGIKLIRIPYHEVSVSDEGKTMRYLEHILQIHGIPLASSWERPPALRV